MREKLNDNPMIQIAVIGVLIVLVGFFFMTRMKGSSSDTAAAPPVTTDPATGAPAATTTPAATDPATGAPVTDPAAAAAAGTAAPAAAPPVASASDFTAGPGLPKQVVNAYNGGDAVALLITKQKGVDDKAMRKAVSSIRGKAEVDLFTVRVHDVAKYSRIARGVDLDRAPALVVIQPKKHVAKASPPEATVTYGFRTPQDVAQAVEDSLFDGKDKGYSPG